MILYPYIPTLLASALLLAATAISTPVSNHQQDHTVHPKRSQTPPTDLSILDITQDRGTHLPLPPAAYIPTTTNAHACLYDLPRAPLRADVEKLSGALGSGEEEVTKSDSVGQCYVAFTYGSARLSLCIKEDVKRRKMVRSNGWMKEQLAEYVDGLLGDCWGDGEEEESELVGGAGMFDDMEGFFFLLDRRD
ncbi:MAG: hypothetical protein M1831_002971 [Alyxoria varia]|nr:MAG: hypothetical protein M1831_002971 [Alyxoria varia]